MHYAPSNPRCNGKRYIVKSAEKHVIEAIVATGTHEGNQLFIPRIVLTPSDNLCPFTMHRKQFPIRPAFKSQGQTLKRVMIYLPKRMFCHGQLYVAMSRVGEYAEVKLCVADESFLRDFQFVIMFTRR